MLDRPDAEGLRYWSFEARKKFRETQKQNFQKNPMLGTSKLVAGTFQMLSSDFYSFP